MAWKIALAGIFHESNTFLHTYTCLEDFRRGHWLKGEDIRKEYAAAYHEIGGMLEVMDAGGVEIRPVFFAEATPGGIVTAEAYDRLLKELLEGLDRAGAVDGCLVVPHGAGVSETYRDMDGHWLSAVRHKLGDHVPIVGTLDPHANVSPMMVGSTDALIAYRTNPHVDQRETGRRAAELLLQILKGCCRPRQRLFQLPLAINIQRQGTKDEPCRSLYAAALEMEKKRGVLSISILLGFPYADVEEMGTSVLVVEDGGDAESGNSGGDLAGIIWGNRHDLAGGKADVEEVVRSLKNREKPVLLLDMGDNIGAGAPGNSVYLLEMLEKQGGMRYFGCICDASVVRRAEGVTVGGVLSVPLAGDICFVKILLKADGRFAETAPRHGGQLHFDMGRIAVVQTENGSVIMYTSLRIPPFSLRQLTEFGVEPAAFDVLVAKGVHAPIAAYGPVCRTLIQVDTPGVTQSDMTKFTFRHRRKPLFPFEDMDQMGSAWKG
jgi:microcystin degradation protein MlrC